MKFIILLLSLSVLLYSGVSNFSTYNPKTIKCISIPPTNGFDNIFSDDDFFWFNCTLEETIRFVKSYKGNLFKTNEIKHIYDCAKLNNISILFFLTKIQLESGLITWDQGFNETYYSRMCWILGAGMYQSIISNGIYIKPYKGFYKQIEFGANRIKYHYDNFKKGASVSINEGRMKVIPKNGVTYVLYKYTPYWGLFEENGVRSRGNEIFLSSYNTFKKRWILTNHKNDFAFLTNIK